MQTGWGFFAKSGQTWPSSGDLTGNRPQVEGDNAPTDPAVHAVVAVIPTTVQTEAALEQADMGFMTGAPVATRAEPGLTFISQASRRLRAGFG